MSRWIIVKTFFEVDPVLSLHAVGSRETSCKVILAGTFTPSKYIHESAQIVIQVSDIIMERVPTDIDLFFFKENDNFCFRFLPKPPDTHWLKTVLKMLNTGTISRGVVPVGHMDTKTWENMVQIKKYQSYTLRPLFPFDSIWFRYITMNIRPAFRSVTLQIYQNNLRICLLQLSTLKLLVSVFVSPVHTDREEISS